MDEEKDLDLNIQPIVPNNTPHGNKLLSIQEMKQSPMTMTMNGGTIPAGIITENEEDDILNTDRPSFGFTPSLCHKISNPNLIGYEDNNHNDDNMIYII